jgi:hypothetical protein
MYRSRMFWLSVATALTLTKDGVVGATAGASPANTHAPATTGPARTSHAERSPVGEWNATISLQGADALFISRSGTAGTYATTMLPRR